MNIKTVMIRCGLAVYLLAQPVVAQTDKPSLQEMRLSDDAYRVGTDIGMLYLSQHSARLRITLLLQECNVQDIASLVAAGPADVLHNLFGRSTGLGFLSHFCSPYLYDEPEIRLCSTQPICPMRPDVGHLGSLH